MASERRLHPASVVFTLGSTAKNFVLPGIATIFASRSGEWGVGLGLTAVLVPLSLIALVKVLSIRYRFEEHELVIRSGFVFRSVRHLPYGRIHNLDAVQSPLHRILGVAEVRIETGGGAEAEAALRVISLQALDEMRREVFERRRAEAPAPAVAGEGVSADEAASRIEPAATPPPPASEVILRLAPRELMLSGFIHSKGILVIGALFSLLFEFRLFESYLPDIVDDLTGRDMMRQLGRAFIGQAELPAVGLTVAAIGFSLLLLALRVLSMFWTAVTLHGYTLVHQANDLRAEFGFFTRVSATTPLKRAQALTVQEGPLHRIFGRVTVRLQSVGKATELEQRPVRETVAPILRSSAVPAFINRIFPGIDMGDGTWHRAHPRAFRRTVIVPAFTFVLLSLPLIYFRPVWGLVLASGLLAWAALNAWMYVRSTGWRTTNDAVFFKSGWILKQMTIVRVERIQAVSMRETPFDRRHRMATVLVDTLGANGAPHMVRIPYVARAEAVELFNDLYRRAAHVEFSV